MTIEHAAQLMNVKVRGVYMAKELLRTGRAEPIRAAEVGKISLLGALKLAKPDKYAKTRNGEKGLRDAWAKATDEERAAFTAWLRAQANRNDEQRR